ncbi:MAG: hypothetical protein JNM42_13540 [Propionivibrio sp.]|uniref:hypothetical protein n=1 Tax=Propionivibrio sp. TaxID=2212460 RepID=UPI001A4E6E5B|nr:hypothetical protein [Propionivibrio sp.]MBL8415455.1 hypothetical protein [Propionivibrio sp.]
MKKFATLLAPFCLAACISIADAGTLVDVSVTDRTTGEKLEVYRHQGRLYVAGTPGNRYAVNLRNKSGGRVLTVISVDGVNALNGQTAATSQSGYVISPWQAAEISGWRKSMDDVAAFYFTSIADSYAARTDRPQNVGVIGVAVYREADPLPPPAQAAFSARERVEQGSADRADHAAGNESDQSQSRASAPASAPPSAAPERSEALSKKAEGRLGTGHGERISAPTQYTEFRRASDTPSEIVTIYYNSRANLLAQGVIPRPPHYGRTNPAPNPFPGGFVPDPRG